MKKNFILALIFYGCSGLKGVYISDIAAWCNIEFDGSYSNPLEYAHNLYLNDILVTDLVIPNTVTIIKGYAFNGASCLQSITIPDSVTLIGSSAFSGCSLLTTINFEGAKAQWNDIVKATGWGYFSGEFTVYFIDGSIAKNDA